MADYRAFVRGLPRALADELGDAAPPHHGSPTRSMAKLWFGNKQLHYECGVYVSRKVIELGLHFESDAMTNLQLLGAFRARAKRIARRLPSARIEAWDKGWARIWEPIELGPLGERDAARITALLATYVRVLEPILEAELPANVAWSR
ncbi:MAG: hypothetical protein ACYC9W_07520 [Candidatus Limnocylindria bacterium]